MPPLRDARGRFVKASGPLKFRDARGRFASSNPFYERKTGVALTPGRAEARAAINQQQIARLIKRLNAFGRSLVNKHLRTALRAGAKPVQAAVRANAPVLGKVKKGRSSQTRRFLRPRPRKSPRPVRGLLKRSFGVRAMKRKKDRIGFVVITGKKYKAAYYGRFVEQGTHSLAPGIRRQHTKGFAASHGKQRIVPRRFIQRGFDQTKGQALRIIRNLLRQGVRQAAAEARSVA